MSGLLVMFLGLMYSKQSRMVSRNDFFVSLCRFETEMRAARSEYSGQSARRPTRLPRGGASRAQAHSVGHSMVGARFLSGGARARDAGAEGHGARTRGEVRRGLGREVIQLSRGHAGVYTSAHLGGVEIRLQTR